MPTENDFVSKNAGILESPELDIGEFYGYHSIQQQYNKKESSDGFFEEETESLIKEDDENRVENDSNLVKTKNYKIMEKLWFILLVLPNLVLYPIQKVVS